MKIAVVYGGAPIGQQVCVLFFFFPLVLFAGLCVLVVWIVIYCLCL